MQSELPVEVGSGETILRAVRTPAHIKAQKGGGYKLKTAFLKSPAGADEVSVMRLSYMGLVACRERARVLPQYFGLATVAVQTVRDQLSEVVDSRQEFLGHADLKHGVILPVDEPPDSEQAELLNERIRKILEGTRLEVDPAPAAEDWQGPDLL